MDGALRAPWRKGSELRVPGKRHALVWRWNARSLAHARPRRGRATPEAGANHALSAGHSGSPILNLAMRPIPLTESLQRPILGAFGMTSLLIRA